MLRLTATPNLSGAACIGMDPDLFAPDNPKRPDADALWACQRCPVTDACLTWAVAGKETGIFGGQSLLAGRIVKPAVHPPRPDRQKPTVAAAPPAPGICRDCGTPAEPPRWYCEPCRAERRGVSAQKAEKTRKQQRAGRACRHCGVPVAVRRSVCDTCRKARWAEAAKRRPGTTTGRCRTCGASVAPRRKLCTPCTATPLAPAAALLAAEVAAFQREHRGSSTVYWAQQLDRLGVPPRLRMVASR